MTTTQESPMSTTTQTNQATTTAAAPVGAWKWVPVRLTPEMLVAGAHAACTEYDLHGNPDNPEADRECATGVWEDILKVAPPAPFGDAADLGALAELVPAAGGALADLQAMVAGADRGEVWVVVNAGTRARLETLAAVLARLSAGQASAPLPAAA